MNPKTTLATEVTIHTSVGVERRRDVLISVSSGRRTVIDFNMESGGNIRVALTEPERVSLIEALGGKP